MDSLVEAAPGAAVRRVTWYPPETPCPECGLSYGYPNGEPKSRERIAQSAEADPVRDVPATTAHGVIKDGYLALVCPTCRRIDFIQQPPGLEAQVRTGGRYWKRTTDGWREVA